VWIKGFENWVTPSVQTSVYYLLQYRFMIASHMAKRNTQDNWTHRLGCISYCSIAVEHVIQLMGEHFGTRASACPVFKDERPAVAQQTAKPRFPHSHAIRPQQRMAENWHPDDQSPHSPSLSLQGAV